MLQILFYSVGLNFRIKFLLSSMNISLVGLQPKLNTE